MRRFPPRSRSLSRAGCLPLLLAAMLAAGCRTVTVPPTAEGVTFIVVRHAEKAIDDPDDPSLSAAGQARAEALALALREAPLRAAYATEFRRTQQTVAPVAKAHGLPVDAYYARGPADEIASRWKRQHARGAVLVVGHSNTVPELVSALCGCRAEPMDDSEYDRLSRVHLDAEGRAALKVERYGAPGAPRP